MFASVVKSVAIAGVVAFTTSAMADGMPRRSVKDFAPPPAPFSWTGFYAGVNAGYHWGTGDLAAISTAGPCDPNAGGACIQAPTYSTLSARAATFTSAIKNDGFIGGVGAGYNWMLGGAVFGIEADIQTLDGNHSRTFSTTVPSPTAPAIPLQQTATVSASLEYLATLRARLGILVGPSWLFYVTGGLAIGGADSSVSITQFCDACVLLRTPTTAGLASNHQIGWTAGLGSEVKLNAHWSVKGEWLYYELQTLNYTLPTLIAQNGVGVNPLFMSSTTRINTDLTGHIARVGLNYKF